MVPWRGHLPLKGFEELAAGNETSEPLKPAQHDGQSGFRRNLGASAVLRGRSILAHLHGRKSDRRPMEGLPQLSRDLRYDRRRMVRADLFEQLRLRSIV